MEPEIAQMRIVTGWPPMKAEIVKAFPHAVKEGVLFCWGNTIFNPSDVPVPYHVAAHENVHRKQQGAAPFLWWANYIAKPEFRLSQEIPAHQVEYRQYCIDFPQRNMRRLGLKFMANRLSGPLYGNLLTFEKAKAIIKRGVDE